MRTEAATVKSRRFEARISAEQKELFQRAADLTGRSVTDFVLGSAQAAAVEVIKTRQVIELTERDTAAFVEAFLNPLGPNEAMRRYARRYQKLVERK